MSDPRLDYLPKHLREKTVLSVEDVLPILGVSESHLRRQIRAGEFPHRYIGARCVIPVPMFLEWLTGKDASTLDDEIERYCKSVGLTRAGFDAWTSDSQDAALAWQRETHPS